VFFIEFKPQIHKENTGREKRRIRSYQLKTNFITQIRLETKEKMESPV